MEAKPYKKSEGVCWSCRNESEQIFKLNSFR